MKIKKEDVEFLSKYYQGKIDRHEKIIEGCKIALRDLNANSLEEA